MPAEFIAPPEVVSVIGRPGNLPSGVGDLERAIESALAEAPQSGRTIADAALKERFDTLLAQTTGEVRIFLAGLAINDLRETQRFMRDLDRAIDEGTWGESGVRGSGEADAQSSMNLEARQTALENRLGRALPKTETGYYEVKRIIDQVLGAA